MNRCAALFSNTCQTSLLSSLSCLGAPGQWNEPSMAQSLVRQATCDLQSLLNCPDNAGIVQTMLGALAKRSGRHGSSHDEAEYGFACAAHALCLHHTCPAPCCTRSVPCCKCTASWLRSRCALLCIGMQRPVTHVLSPSFSSSPGSGLRFHSFRCTCAVPWLHMCCALLHMCGVLVTHVLRPGCTCAVPCCTCVVS